MQTISRSTFTTVKTEGGLLPADLLQRIADGKGVEGLRPEEDFHLLRGERLNEAINRAWNRCLGAWLSFDEQRHVLPSTDTGTTLTRERWLLVLFQELGYGRLQIQRGGLETPDGVSYPISHLWENTTPIHLVTFRQDLDKRSELATQVKRSPHSLMQEFLNRSPAYQWGIIANGLQLRLLRDNASLRRAAYVEFDLEAMMTGELYAEFSLLWLVCHQSRVERIGSSEVGSGEIEGGEIGDADEDAESTAGSLLPTPSTCWLEVWSKQAADQGTRALDALRDGVAEAIQALGRGFLAHPANTELRRRLQAGDLAAQDYYQQLRRLVYRLIFLCVAEDRDLLLLPGTDDATRRRYQAYYSLQRLRGLAATLRGGPHADLYRQLRLLAVLLRQGYPPLGLPGLGSFLFSERSTPDLDGLELANRDLLDALRGLTFTVQNNVRRAVDYRNLDSEELGSVYESLLELHPKLNIAAATFALETGAGSERKTTGSHYTPTSLVECLLDSALEPVVADRLREVGSRQIGSRGKGKDGGDSVVSGSAGMAGGDGVGRLVLPGDAGVAAGGALRADQPGAPGGDVDPGEYRGGLRPGGAQGIPPISAHRAGFVEGARDPSVAGGARRPGESGDDDAAVSPMRRVGQDAPHLDPQTGRESGVERRGDSEVGSSEVGSSEVGSSEVGSSALSPHSLPPYSPLEQAILAIKVLDFAAGSGHMLIGAGRRLARHLARIRTGDDEPTPDALRTAMRDVVRHCLYGVDVNDMAVELCKVALWMETLEPGKPLSFLDKNIQCGNSLIGVTPGLDIEEIPDDAFQPQTGDDKITAAGMRRRNKKEREGQLALQLGSGAPQPVAERFAGWRAQAMAALATQAEDAVEQVAAKESAYAGYLKANEYQWSRLENDLWTAAFFWPIPAGDPGDLLAPTQRVLRSLRSGKEDGNGEIFKRVNRIARCNQFFHWALQFPDVFAGVGSGEVGSTDPTAHSTLTTPHSPFPRSPGFDVVLSNPPWERIKLQEKEWFAARHPEIANAPNAAARRRRIDALAQEDPALYKAFLADRRGAEAESHFIRNSGKYPLCGRGDVNTYAVFAELARQVVSPVGRAGVIVPSGIATDDTTKYYFQAVMETKSLASLYDFENRNAIFPGVHRSYKFCLLTLTGEQRPATAAEFVFFALEAADLGEEQRRFTLSAEEIALLNPNTRTCPIFRSKRDAELTKNIYRNAIPLFVEGHTNDWNVTFL